MVTTNVFGRNLAAYIQAKNGKGPSLICNRGGQGSSKTISILQLIYLIAKKRKYRISMASYALPHLKAGAMQDFDQILWENGENIQAIKSRSESIYYFKSGTKIDCIGITGNEARATGPRRDILYVNEANRKIDWKVFGLMNSRTHQCAFIDWNPSSPFWFDDHIQPEFKHKLIQSTYLDNEKLPKRELENLLSKKDNPKYANWWKVYGLGLLGQLEGSIFEDWEYGEFNDSLPVSYGLDFGSKDPDALVKVAVDKKLKLIYIKEELYKSGLSTNNLADAIKARNVGHSVIIADSSGKRTIQDLRSNGLNVVAAKKYGGSVIDGIKLMWDYKLIITEDSHNLSKELNNYIWLDKRGEIPVDGWNHLIDASRYNIMRQTKSNRVILH